MKKTCSSDSNVTQTTLSCHFESHFTSFFSLLLLHIEHMMCDNTRVTTDESNPITLETVQFVYIIYSIPCHIIGRFCL